MLPTASIFMRHWLDKVVDAGIVTVLLPLFIAFSASIEYVCPLFVDNKIFTFDVLIPFPVVPATFHVIVCCDPMAQGSAGLVVILFGYVITNGPTLANVIVTSADFVWPPPFALLSRTVVAKDMVLATDGNLSQVEETTPLLFVVPAKTVSIDGKDLDELLVGPTDLKFGPVLEFASGGCIDDSLLVCSYV